MNTTKYCNILENKHFYLDFDTICFQMNVGSQNCFIIYKFRVNNNNSLYFHKLFYYFQDKNCTDLQTC